jgi:hypothetical protein
MDPLESLIYGDSQEKAAPIIPSSAEPEPKPPDAGPEVDAPSVQIQLSGFDWWITDKEIEQQLSSVGEGVFQIANLNLLHDEGNGRFRGTVEALLRTDEPENQILSIVSRAFPANPADPNSKIVVRLMPKPVVKAAKPVVVQAAKPVKPAPMLYEEPGIPIPRYLLREDAKNDRGKKNDDLKRHHKDRDREDRHHRHRLRDKHRRREDRDWSDSYSDYDYDYDYDRKGRKDDRDDRNKRRRDEDGHRAKRRK